jgi:hypothetical protein
MKSWFASRNGAIVLSALALLAFIGYTLMEMRYYLEKWIPGDVAAAVEGIIILLIAGGWLRALFVASNGKRGGLSALLALSVFNILIGLYDLQYALNPVMPWPERTMVFVAPILGLIAAVSLVFQLRKK